MNNAYLFNSLNLHLRLHFPTYIFGETKFEIDDNYKPYWVSQVIDYSFVGKAQDVKGVVVTDPVNGESNYYDVKEDLDIIKKFQKNMMLCLNGWRNYMLIL